MHRENERPLSRRHFLNIAALLIVFFIVGMLFGANASGLAQYFGLQAGAEQLGKIQFIYNLVRDNHVDPTVLEGPEAIDRAIKGLLADIDGGYTRYETAAEAQQFNESIQGHYGGVGIRSLFRTEDLLVEAVFRGTPAQQAGIQIRDRIVAVDGVPVRGRTQGEVNNSIRGVPGTDVTLTVIREGQNTPIDITMTRARITIPVVEHHVEGDIGVLILTDFTETAPVQLREAIVDLKNQGVEAILLDLRFNPGGLLTSAEEIADFFLPKELAIVRTVDRRGGEVVRSTRREPLYDGPLFVLINRGSASASEVLAGALQDHERATILGEQSFGKGTVQMPFPLFDGSRVWVTVNKYLTPTGRDINQKGMAPDIEVVQPEGATEDIQLQHSLQLMNTLIER